MLAALPRHVVDVADDCGSTMEDLLPDASGPENIGKPSFA